MREGYSHGGSKPSNCRPREYDVAQDIRGALAQTARAYHQALRAELSPHAITVRQCQVLGWLRKKGDLSQCQLARLLTIEPATLAGMMKRMERDGLILRIADCSDGRKKLIRLTRHAEELCDTVVECSARVCARALRGVSQEEINSLRELLQRIMTNLQ